MTFGSSSSLERIDVFCLDDTGVEEVGIRDGVRVMVASAGVGLPVAWYLVPRRLLSEEGRNVLLTAILSF